LLLFLVCLSNKRLQELIFKSKNVSIGQFYVIGFYWEDFNRTYGRYPDDLQIAQISQDNSGDEIRLKDQFGNMVHDLNFATRRPWSEVPDGYGYSLVAKPENYQDIALDSAVAKDKHVKFWRYSDKIDGSPWKDDVLTTPRPPVPIKFTMISYFTDPQYIELFNPTTANIDISGWIFSKNYNSQKSYKFPVTSIIAAGKILRVLNTTFGFSLGDGNKENEFTLFDAIKFTTKQGNTKLVTSGEYSAFTPLELAVKKRELI